MDESYLDLLMAQQDEVSEAEGGGGGVWVVAEVAGGALAPVTLEALGAARTLADSLGAYVYGVLVGSEVADLSQTMYQAGSDGVRVADDSSLADYALEPYLAVLAPLFEAEQPEVVVFGATDSGQEMAARLAQRMGGGLIERVTAVSLDEATRTVQAASPIYGGEYYELEACPEARPQFLTVEPRALPTPIVDPYRKGEPTTIEFEPVEPAVREVGPAEDFEPPQLPLGRAPVIVTAGRLVGDLTMVQQLAEALGGRVAGDRGARDAGLIEPEQMVDVRGIIVAPHLYVAVGVRGDTFHNAAMDESGFIVAIHSDPDAPIFQIADLCIEADPQEVIPHLLAAL